METTMNEGATRLALARSCIYHNLSALFLYPEEENILSLNWEEAEEAVALLGNPDGLKEAFRSIGGSLKGVTDLQSEYIKIYGHAVAGDCPPYETEYGGDQGGAAQIFQQSQTLSDIAGFYRAFGLDVSDVVRERVDHISVELEFMAFLAYKEAYALIADGEEKEKAERVEICREAQRMFLNDHLGRWVQDFTRRLEQKAQDGPYSRLARLTGKFLACEIKAIEAQPMQVEGLAPIVPDTEGLCEKCEIKDACFSDAGALSLGASQSVF